MLRVHAKVVATLADVGRMHEAKHPCAGGSARRHHEECLSAWRVVRLEPRRVGTEWLNLERNAVQRHTAGLADSKHLTATGKGCEQEASRCL